MLLNINTRFEVTATKSISTINFTDGTGQNGQIFYEFEGRDRPMEKPCGNFALVAMLPYAMAHGLDIEISEPVDLDLLEALEENQDAWLRWHPSYFKPIKINASCISAPSLPKDRTAIMAFSGGLDATYALHMNRRGLLGQRSVDVNGAVLIHGFDLPLDKPEWFVSAKKSAGTITDSYSVPLTTARTNWRDLGLDWERCFIFGVSAVMHQFKSKFGYAVIAADEAYEGEVLGWGSNSITNQMMSGVSFPLRFVGAGMSRTGKAARLSNEPAVLQNLRVCWEYPEEGNCGHCEKCVRTKLNFLASGVQSVPALGSVVTVDEVGKVRLQNAATYNLYKELLVEGDWSEYSEIKKSLSMLVKFGIKNNKFHRILRKYKNSFIKRMPFINR